MVQRMRVAVLVGLAVVAVLAFLVAPTDGRFARVPLMVLCGVLALIWHLAVGGAVHVPAPPATEPISARSTVGSVGAATADATPVGVALPAEQVETVHPAGFFEVEAEPVSVPPEVALVQREDAEVELAGLPDPPANWPPTVVEVPLVFQVDASAPAPQPEPDLDVDDDDDEPIHVIDLTATDAVVRGAADPDQSELDLSDLDLTGFGMTSGDVVPLEHAVAVGASGPVGDDPWLAFAATMFGPQAR